MKHTLQRHARHQDCGGDDKQVVLHLASGRLAEIQVTSVENIFQAHRMPRPRYWVQPIEDFVEFFPNFLTSTHSEHVDDFRIKEAEQRVILVETQGVDVICEVVQLAMVKGPYPNIRQLDGIDT